MTPDYFSPQSLQELRDRVGYEDWLLESVYRLAEEELFPHWPDEFVYELDAQVPVVTAYGRMDIMIGDWRPGFLDAGAPLVFTAGFKLLDMLFEWLLERNGRQVDFRFSRKLQQLMDPELHYPTMLSSRSWLLDRLKKLYEKAEPLRGTIIHSRHFESTNGTLRVASSKHGAVGAVVELDATELRIFAQFSVSVLRFLQGDWEMSDHRDKVLRWQLDSLQKLHKQSMLGQQEPRHTRVRLYTCDPRLQNVDVDRIRRDLAAQDEDHDMTFDLRIIVLQGRTAVAAYLVPHEHLPQLATLASISRFCCDLPA